MTLVARDPGRLSQAAAALRALAPASDVETLVLDVTDELACRAMAAAWRTAGRRISWLVTSAGMAWPGRFLEGSGDDHRRHMDVNYFGTLNLVQAFSPSMVRQGSGRIVMIASAAALVGVGGYAAYCPSKFAVRGLAEVLRVELARHGISVTLAYPPDTDTPQWRAEQEARPAETAAFAAAGGVVTAARVAGDIMAGAETRRFAVSTGAANRALVALHSLLAPVLRWRQRALAVAHAAPEPPRQIGPAPAG